MLLGAIAAVVLLSVHGGNALDAWKPNLDVFQASAATSRLESELKEAEAKLRSVPTSEDAMGNEELREKIKEVRRSGDKLQSTLSAGHTAAAGDDVFTACGIVFPSGFDGVVSRYPLVGSFGGAPGCCAWPHAFDNTVANINAAALEEAIADLQHNGSAYVREAHNTSSGCAKSVCPAAVTALQHIYTSHTVYFGQQDRRLLEVLTRDVCDILGEAWLSALELLWRAYPSSQHAVLHAAQQCTNTSLFVAAATHAFSQAVHAAFQHSGSLEALASLAGAARDIASTCQVSSPTQCAPWTSQPEQHTFAQLLVDIAWVALEFSDIAVLLDDVSLLSLIRGLDAHVAQPYLLLMTRAARNETSTAASDAPSEHQSRCLANVSFLHGRRAAEMLKGLMEQLPRHRRPQPSLATLFQLVSLDAADTQQQLDLALYTLLKSEVMCGVNFESSAEFKRRLVEYLNRRPRDDISDTAAAMLCKVFPDCARDALRSDGDACTPVKERTLAAVLDSGRTTDASSIQCEDVAAAAYRDPEIDGAVWWHSYVALLTVTADSGNNCIRRVVVESYGSCVIAAALCALAGVAFVYAMKCVSLSLMLRACIVAVVVVLIADAAEDKLTTLEFGAAADRELRGENPYKVISAVVGLANSVAAAEKKDITTGLLSIPLPMKRTEELCASGVPHSFSSLGSTEDDPATRRGLLCTVTILMQALHYAVNSSSSSLFKYPAVAHEIVETAVLLGAAAVKNDSQAIHPLLNAPLWGLLHVVTSTFPLDHAQFNRLRGVINALFASKGLHHPIETSATDRSLNSMLLGAVEALCRLNKRLKALDNETRVPTDEAFAQWVAGAWVRTGEDRTVFDDVEALRRRLDETVLDEQNTTCPVGHIAGAAQWAVATHGGDHVRCFVLNESDAATSLMDCVRDVYARLQGFNEYFSVFDAFPEKREAAVCGMVTERLKMSADGSRALHLFNDTMLPHAQSGCQRLRREANWTDEELLLFAESAGSATRFAHVAGTALAYGLSGDSVFRSAVANHLLSGSMLLHAAFVPGPYAGATVGSVNTEAELEALSLQSEINVEEWSRCLRAGECSGTLRKHMQQRYREARQLQSASRLLLARFPSRPAFTDAVAELSSRIGSAESEHAAIVDAVAVVSAAAHHFLGRDLRFVQYLALTELVSLSSDVTHKVLQILTSEGKTITLAVAAIATHYVELYYHRNVSAAMCVRILTTTPQLVRDNIGSVRRLYDGLRVSVDHNLEDYCPPTAVTYGTFETLARDDLAGLGGSPMCANHVAQACTTFVDEDDLERYESIANSRRLKVSNSDLKTGMWYLDGIFHIIFYRLGLFSSATVRVNDTCVMLNVSMFDEGDANTSATYSRKQKLLRFDSVKAAEEFFINKTSAEVLDAVHDGRFATPSFLHSVVKDQARLWVEHAVLSASLRENEEFVVQGDRNGRARVEPVTRSTGAINSRMRWENGLHQFVELRRVLAMQSLTPVSQFVSTHTFLSIGKRTRGVTGTPGSSEDRIVARRMFDDKLQMWSIPSHYERRLVVYADTELSSVEQIIEQATIEAINFANQGRAVLIVVPVIAVALRVHDTLRSFYAQPDLVQLYTGRSSDVILIASVLQPGSIIVSTNIGGRGTDLQLSDSVLWSGGLHVIGTERMFNTSTEQMFRRGARCGTKGSAHLYYLAGTRQPTVRTDHFFEFKLTVAALDNASLFATRRASSMDISVERRYFEQQFAFLVSSLWSKALPTKGAESSMSAEDVREELDSFFESFSAPHMSHGVNVFAQMKAEWRGIRLNTSNISADAAFHAPYYLQQLRRSALQIDRVNDPANWERHRADALQHSEDAQRLIADEEDRLEALAAVAESVRQHEAALRLQIRRVAVQTLKSFVMQSTVTLFECCEERYHVDVWKDIDVEALVPDLRGDSRVNASDEVLERLQEDVAIQLRGEGYYGVSVFRLIYTPPPPKKKSWWGTVWAAVVSVVQGVVGALCTAVGLVNIGMALLKNMVSGLVDVVISIVTGNPIDFLKWLGGQALKFAMSMIMIGVGFISDLMFADPAAAVVASAAAESVNTFTMTTEVVVDLLREEVTSRVVNFAAMAATEATLLPSLDELAMTAAVHAVDNLWSSNAMLRAILCASLSDQVSSAGFSLQRLVDFFASGVQRVISRQSSSTVSMILKEIGCAFAQNTIADPLLSAGVQFALRTSTGAANLVRLKSIAVSAAVGGTAAWQTSDDMQKACDVAARSLFEDSPSCLRDARACAKTVCFAADKSGVVILPNRSCTTDCSEALFPRRACNSDDILAADDRVSRDVSWTRAAMTETLANMLSAMLQSEVVSPIASNLVQPLLTDAMFSLAAKASAASPQMRDEAAGYTQTVGSEPTAFSSVVENTQSGTQSASPSSSASQQPQTARTTPTSGDTSTSKRTRRRPPASSPSPAPRSAAGPAADRFASESTSLSTVVQQSELTQHLIKHKDDYLAGLELVPVIGSGVTLYRMLTEDMAVDELLFNAMTLNPLASPLRWLKKATKMRRWGAELVENAFWAAVEPSKEKSRERKPQ